MTFHTGTTLSIPDAGGLMDELQPLVTAHPAWSLVHRSANGYDVFKCDGALNDWGQDFYVAWGQIGYANSLRTYVFEDYDSANNSIRRPCVRGSLTHLCHADDASFGSTTWHPTANAYGLPALSGAATSTGIFAAYHLVGLDVTEYWLSVTNNRIVLATRTGATVNSCYSGLFESFIPNNLNEFPLVNTRLDQTSTSATVYTVGGWSRHPGREGIANRENFAVYPFSGAPTDWTFSYGQVGGTLVDLFHGTPVGARILTRPLGAQATYGYLRGLLFNVLDIPVSAGVAIGDTVISDGKVWSYLGSNGNWVDTELAA